MCMCTSAIYPINEFTNVVKLRVLSTLAIVVIMIKVFKYYVDGIIVSGE